MYLSIQWCMKNASGWLTVRPHWHIHKATIFLGWMSTIWHCVTFSVPEEQPRGALLSSIQLQVIFLKRWHSNDLSASQVKLFSNFSQKKGRGQSNMWIMKCIHLLIPSLVPETSSTHHPAKHREANRWCQRGIDENKSSALALIAA